MKFKLIQTCGACPEQYDVYLGDKQVGYLRLRHGYFRVDYPEWGGRTIYESSDSQGDGCFENEEERQYFIKKAIEAIKEELLSNEYEIVYNDEDQGEVWNI